MASTGFDPGREAVSSLHFYTVQNDGAGGVRNALAASSSQILHQGESGSGATVFGACGLKFADLVTEPTPDGVDAELIVTTLNGDLLVYDVEPESITGARLGGLLYHNVFDGALGATNSILVDESASPPVIWIAGSMGTRRFTVTTTP